MTLRIGFRAVPWVDGSTERKRKSVNKQKTPPTADPAKLLIPGKE